MRRAELRPGFAPHFHFYKKFFRIITFFYGRMRTINIDAVCSYIIKCIRSR